MISGVFCILLGEAILFGSLPLFFWFLLFVLLNVTYIPLKEEPDLVRKFGKEYLLYKKNVPRWIPLVKPWNSLSTRSKMAIRKVGVHENSRNEKDLLK